MKCIFVQEIKNLVKSLAVRRKKDNLNFDTQFIADQQRLVRLIENVSAEGLREAVGFLRHSYGTELRVSSVKAALEARKDELEGVCKFPERETIKRKETPEDKLLTTPFIDVVKDNEITAEMITYIAEERDDDKDLECQISIQAYPHRLPTRLMMWLCEADNSAITELARSVTEGKIDSFHKTTEALRDRQKQIPAEAELYQLFLEHVSVNNLVLVRSAA